MNAERRNDTDAGSGFTTADSRESVHLAVQDELAESVVC